MLRKLYLSSFISSSYFLLNIRKAWVHIFCYIRKNGGIIGQLYDLHTQYKKKLPMQSIST